MGRRRWGILLLLTLLIAGYLTLAWYFTPPATAITRENALKIKPGMTLAEVEAILGGPARDELVVSSFESISSGMGISLHQRYHESFFHSVSYSWKQLVLHQTNHHVLTWLSSNASIRVLINREGQIVKVDFNPVDRKTFFGIGNWRF